MANKIFQILRNSTVYNDYTTAAAAFNVPADVTGLIDGQLKSARYVDGNAEKAIIGIWNSATNKWSMIDIESSLLHAVLNAKQINVTDPSSNETKALDEVIFENETVTAASLNDLNEKIKAIENANFGNSIENAISTAAEDASTKANAAKEAAISASDVTLEHEDGTLIYTLYQGTDNKSEIGKINIPSFTVVEDHSGAGDDPDKIYIPSAASEKETHDGLSMISQALSRVEAAGQTNSSAITAIEGKIPVAATSENQLADKDFVNSSIATATATFRGTFNLVTDLGSSTENSSHTQIEKMLGNNSVSATADDNDYCFVLIPTSYSTSTVIARIERYKATKGTAIAAIWHYEYTLNNSGYTADQWAAINSYITSGLVTKLNKLPDIATLTTLLNGKQDVITDLDAIRSGAAAGATAVQLATLNDYYTKSEVDATFPFKKTENNGIKRNDFSNDMSGKGSVALGSSGSGRGQFAVTEGYGNIAEGNCSHAEGSTTHASGRCSKSEGEGTYAYGERAHACGRSTIASGENQFVIGQYNIEDTSSLFIIGNGTREYIDTELHIENANALTVDRQGNLWIAGNLQNDQMSEIEASISTLKADWIEFDQNILSPNSMISGDVGGNVLKWIRNNSHRFLGKYTAEGEMTICQLDDSDGTKYKDGGNATLNGTQGDVFMRLPEFYTHFEQVSDKIFRVGFSRYNLGTGWKKWGDNELIGVYEAINWNHKLASIAGSISIGNLSYQDFKTMVRERGNGYSLVKWKHQNIMAFLYYAFYGDTDCQTRIGLGENSFDRTCGIANSLGMTDGQVNGSISFWGLENWWGCKEEIIDNVSVNGMTWTITEDDNTVREVISNIPTDGWQTATALIAGEHLDVIPSTVEGSTSTGFCDGIYMNGNNDGIVTRSGHINDLYGGVAYECVQANTAREQYIGTRIAFKGSIVVVNDHVAFEAISSIN